MTQIRVGPCGDGERFLRTQLLTWFSEPLREPMGETLSAFADGARFAATIDPDPDGDPDADPDPDPTRYAGAYGVFPLEVTVPGPLGSLRQVPVAGLTWVAVHPDARRRGVLTAMLGDHFARTGAAVGGSGLSALHASEPAIYGRHGYGTASWETRVTLRRGATLVAPGLDAAAAAVRSRLLDADDDAVVARVRALMVSLAATRPGAVALPERVLRRGLHDLPQMLRDVEPRRVLVARLDGADAGFAVLRRRDRWSDHTPEGTVEVWVMDGPPAVQLALARRLVDMDLTREVVIRTRALDDPLVAWVGGPRGVQGPPADSLWLRLVDLPLALTTRGYAAPCRVVIDVQDPTLPANHGRWLLDVGPDGVARVGRPDGDRPGADVALTTSQLAAAYLGDRSLLTAHHAGLVQERRPGAVAELDRALRSPVGAGAAVGF